MAEKSIILKLIVDGKESIITLDKVDQQLRELDKKVGGVNLSLKNVTGALGLAFGAHQVLGFLKDSIALVQRKNEVVGKLNATLHSTRFAAGFTADELIKLANHLEELNRYKFKAEDILDASGLLLTFTKINKEVFPEALQLALDMSVRFGGTLSQNIEKVGKALEQPIKGFGLLQKNGFYLEEQQKKQIELFIEQNDLLSAQKLLLEELSTYSAGAAAASVDDYTYRVEKLAKAWESVMLNTGKALTYFATDVYDFWDTIFSSIEDKFDSLTKTLGLPSNDWWISFFGGKDNRFEPTEWSARFRGGNKPTTDSPIIEESFNLADATVGKIKDRIKELNTELDGTVAGSKEYLEIIKEIEKLEDLISRRKKHQREDDKLYNELSVKSKQGQERELEQLRLWYEEKKKIAAGNHNLLINLEEVYNSERYAVHLKYLRKELDDRLDFWRKVKEAREREERARVEKYSKGFIGTVDVPDKPDPLGGMSIEQIRAANLELGTMDALTFSIADGFHSAASAVSSAFGKSFQVFDKANSMVQIFINSLIEATMQALAFRGVSSFIGFLFGGPTGVLAGAAMAEGGIVRKPTISLIGEAGPEAVIPLNQLNSVSHNVGGLDNVEILLSEYLNRIEEWQDSILLEADLKGEDIHLANKRASKIREKNKM